jgi:tRNA G26 N,N-dimethylase Trm1
MGKQMGQKEVNLSLLIGYVILYITKFKDSIKRLLEMINMFHTKAGYKLNI